MVWCGLVATGWHGLSFDLRLTLSGLTPTPSPSCCMLSSVSKGAQELARRVEHTRIDLFQATRRYPRHRKLVDATVLQHVLSWPGCHGVRELSIKGCTQIEGPDLRAVFKDPACRCEKLTVLDLTGCHESVTSVPLFTFRTATSLQVSVTRNKQVPSSCF